MSRRAMLLTTDDVPKYIREIAKRARLLSGNELYNIITEFNQNRNSKEFLATTIYEFSPGYVFRIMARRKLGAIKGSTDDIEKLIKWCKSWGADARVLKEHCYFYNGCNATKAYRNRDYNYWIVLVTDPVCKIFEDNKFFKEEK